MSTTTEASTADIHGLHDRARRVSQQMAEGEAHLEILRLERADVVRALRGTGATWMDVAQVLGVTKQRAHKLGQVHGIA